MGTWEHRERRTENGERRIEVKYMGSYYPKKYNVGDIVETRKVHPCGSKEWEVIRVGADFKIKCLGCGRVVMLPRVKFEKSVKKLIQAAEPDETETGQE